MGLREYRRKRNFRVTAEPRGRVGKKRAALRFVVQKHDASHLHYDFRLELDGVLKSWAVPKGPDLDPSQKRLAMQVEDHPLEYGSFEGTIPPGEYGGGTVLLWDQGTWEPLGNPQAGMRAGRLKFVLHGEKLRGGWMLVRRGGARAAPNERHWFLFKERDEFADPQLSITDDAPLSVVSGRDLPEIAAENDTVWKNGAARSNGRGQVDKAKSASSRRTVARAGHTKQQTKRTPASRAKATADSASEAQVSGVALSHPGRVLYPEQGITKLDLAEYYAAVAEWMLPHVKGRPLALVRCPGGRGKPCFFQKHAGAAPSRHLAPVNVALQDPAEYHLAIRDAAGLISLVQLGVLEIHVWGSRARNLEKPDRLIFDLDPDPSVEWPRVVQAARETRLLLEELGLVSFLKTTGGKGLHVVVPVQARLGWEEAKDFCHAVANLMVRAAPDRYVATMSKAARKGKIFVDYLRNARGATAIAPYSTRARPGAPVSVPIAWEELSDQLHSDHFRIDNLPARLRRLPSDPWAELPQVRQSITKAMRQRLDAR